MLAYKQAGRRWCAVVTYDRLTAGILDEAGIRVLLVGDTAATAVYGHADEDQLTLEEFLPLVRGVSIGAPRALVIADVPSRLLAGTPQDVRAAALRLMAEAGARMVKVEGGFEVVSHIRLLADSGVPVLGHVTGGTTLDDETQVRVAYALAAAGASGVVLKQVDPPTASLVTEVLEVPTIGVDSGPACDAQLRHWQVLGGLRAGPGKQYTDGRALLRQAVQAFRQETERGATK